MVSLPLPAHFIHPHQRAGAGYGRCWWGSNKNCQTAQRPSSTGLSSTVDSSRCTEAQSRPYTGWTLSWHVLLASSKQPFRNFLRWQFHPNPCAPIDIFSMNSSNHFLNLLVLLASTKSFTMLLYTNEQVLFVSKLAAWSFFWVLSTRCIPRNSD